MGAFQGRSRITASDSTPPWWASRSAAREAGLPPPGNDLPVDTTTSIVIVIQGPGIGSGLLIHLGIGRRLQDIANRVDDRHRLRIEALEEEAPV